METQKTIVGKCPLCGADVVKTLKGYACVNSLGKDNTTCNFFIFSTVGNRRMSDSEVSELLAEKRIMLDGFSSKEGKSFPAILTFKEDGSVDMKYQMGTCPICHGTLYLGARSVSCSNYKAENPCKFTIWRNTGGHEMTLKEMEEIISNGATSVPVPTYDNEGNMTEHRFGLNENKEVVRL